MLDFSRVAPHRQEEVARRICVLNKYIAREMTRGEARRKLGLAESSFSLLLRAWLDTGRPENLMGSGRKQRPRKIVTDLQRQVILEAEAAERTQPVSQVMERARRLADLRGVKLPGVTVMKALIGHIRRSRGLRPDAKHDILVTHCAIDVPVRHAEYGAVAPILALVLDIGKEATILGMFLSMACPSVSSTAAALVDALSNDYPPRKQLLNEFRIMIGSDAAWSPLKDALTDTMLPLYFMPARPRSPRELIALLGRQPGGLRLKPDLTNRPEAERFAQVPQGGSALDFEHANAIVRGRLTGIFNAHQEALLADKEEARMLALRLGRLAATHG